MQLRSAGKRCIIKFLSILLSITSITVIYPLQSAHASSYIEPLAYNVRYIRDYVTPFVYEPLCQWTEIQVFSDDVNVALGKKVTSLHPGVGGTNIQCVTDGLYANADAFHDDGSYGENYVQIDLGSNFDIDKIVLWHIYDTSIYTSHQYADARTEVSSDGFNWEQVSRGGSFIESTSGYNIIRNAGGVVADCIDSISGKTNVTIHPPANEVSNYRIYRRSYNGTFEYVNCITKPKIKVLNIYPDSGISKMTTFTSTIDGQTYSLPVTASAKQWIEEATTESKTGYGKGLISVNTVPFSDFNASPDSYLKDSSGANKYDVIFIGSYCDNSRQDLTATAVTTLEKYIDEGYGVLFGRDVILNIGNRPKNSNKLRSYLKMKLANKVDPNNNFGFNPEYSDIDENYTEQNEYNYLEIDKSDLITQYPWNLGNSGDHLRSIGTNSTAQFAQGDVWIKIYGDNTVSPYGDCNAYLTTYGNVGMIQLGNNLGNAAEDEKMALANALFYLAQSTNSTTFTDTGAKDTADPSLQTHKVTHNDDRTQYTVSYDCTDPYTVYDYRVIGIRQSDRKMFVTDYSPDWVSSGMKGYYISTDQSPNAKFTIDNPITTTEKSFTFPRPAGSDFYVHVAGVDNAGNITNVLTQHVDELITISHPISVNYAIDPNGSPSFVSADIPITNKSKIPVKVSVQNFSASSGGDIKLNDVSPQKYDDWTKLGLAQTKDIALGLKIKENKAGTGTWSAINKNDTLYAADVTEKQLLGTLNPNGAKGTLSLSAKFGMAWDKIYNVTHNLSFVFDVT